MAFRISPLAAFDFSHLFGKDTAELAAAGVIRVIADTKPGYPCRVSLEDAEPGESLLLVNYEHQDAPSPYRSRHAVFVREGAADAAPDVNEVPESLRIRMLSVRGFDASGMMIDADLVKGARLETLIDTLFDDDRIDYLHVHYAKPGCYAGRVDRA